ncbi:MAG: succinylglutamate desuccinylase/aspartoacylase family protein [Oligoflexia bacterium]|nr:succinylglutamate desuccinylase/aspartoacylase family protein [Oligoflexia bacterium]
MANYGLVWGLFLLLFSHSAFSQTKYEQIKAGLVQMASKNPQNARLIKIGESDANDSILGLQIGHGPVNTLVVATHHGNEYGSTYVAMSLADNLSAQPLTDQTVFVIPVLNISGFNAGQRRELARGTSWDANRNYPGPCGTEGPFTLKSTNALAQFIEAANIVTSATLHTYSPFVLYPWGHSTHQTSTPYDNIFIQMGKAATVESKYPVGNSTQMLYPADGTYEDYAFWKHGIWSMLFELGDTHNPSQSDLKTMAEVNVPGLKRMLAMAPKTRAINHQFTGQCDVRGRFFDRHDE